MIDSLYTKYADYYYEIAKDRNFSKECEFINTIVNKKNKIKILELFAGPAYHSIEFKNNFKGITWAIDSSNEMRKLALKYGFEKSNQYIIDALPSAIENINCKFDCIICMRYSLGYLDREELFILLKKLKQKLSKGGKIFFELHKIDNVVSNLNNISIQKRTIVMKTGESVECFWPYDEINWSADDFEAKMNVKIKVSKEKNTLFEKTFQSLEIIYSVEEIKFISSILKYKWTLLETKNLFLNSKILILEK